MIPNKQVMYQAYERGAFGNKLRTWVGLEALRKSGYRGLVTLRYQGDAGGGPSRYNLTLREVEIIAESTALDPKRMMFNESAPDETLLLQGEVQHGTAGWTLRYSTIKAKMRDAMPSAQHAYRIKALCILKQAMQPSSYSDLMALFDLHPTSVVEFSAYQIPLGSLLGRNSIVWEVRDY